MKKLLLIPLIFIASLNFAQQQSIQESVQGAVDNLFDLSQNEDYAKIALKIAFTGKDEARNLKDNFNYEDSKEASKVKRETKKIKAFLDISDTHEFGNFKTKNENGVEIYVIEVIFQSGEQNLKTEFSFVNVKGNLLLVEVN